MWNIKKNTCNSGGKAPILSKLHGQSSFPQLFFYPLQFFSPLSSAQRSSLPRLFFSHQLLSSQLSKLSLSQSCSQTPHHWLMNSCSSLIGGLRWTKLTTSSPLSWDEMIGDEMIGDQLIKRGNCNCKINGTI